MKAKSRPAPRGRRARPVVEALGRRLVPAVFSGLVNGQLLVNDTAAVDTVTLDHVGTNTIVNGASFADSSITNGIKITVGTGVGKFDTVNILATTKPVTVDGQFDIASAAVGKNGSTLFISAPVHFTNFNGNLDGDFIVDDSASPFPRNITLNVVNEKAIISGMAASDISFDEEGIDRLTLNGGSGGNTFTIQDTPNGGVDQLTTTFIASGTGKDTVNVQRTNFHSTVTIEGQAGRDTVNVSRIHHLDQIIGNINVSNNGSFTDLVLDDSTNPVPGEFEITNLGFSGFRDQDFVNIRFNSLEPGEASVVRYDIHDVSLVEIKGNGAGNKFIVDELRDSPTTYPLVLDTGTGGDFTRVLNSKANLTINGQNGADLVNVGSDLLPAGSMKGIKSDLTVTNQFNFSQLILNDAGDAFGHFVTMDMLNSDFGRISGLSPGNILYNVHDISHMNINGGSVVDTFAIKAVAGPSVQINGLGGDDKFIVGSSSNTLDPITSTLQLNGNSGFDTVTINDQGSTLGHVYTVTPTSVKRSFNGPAININFSVDSLILNKGPFFSSPPLAKDLELTDKVRAGELATLTGTLWDSDANDVLSLTVDWGDGSEPYESTPDRDAFSVSHRYAAPGTYVVRAIWTDNTGQSNFRELLITVKPSKKK